MDILAQLQITMDQTEACEGDGSAHEEWLEARGVNKLELTAIEALVATTGLPLGQLFRVAFECGYKQASDSLRLDVTHPDQ